MALCQESVYNLIPLAQFVPEKPPRHKSKYPGKLDEHALVYPMGVPKLRNSHKTFGVPEGHNSKHPSEFTRAHTGTAVLSDPKPPTHPKTKLKDNTPTRKDKPVMNLKSGKNFLTANAVEAILSHPKSVKQDLPYTMKPDFGKVPKYIARNKAKVATEQAQVEEYLRLRDSEVCFTVLPKQSSNRIVFGGSCPHSALVCRPEQSCTLTHFML